MNLTTRKSADRGLANHGWLKSHHTFSFAEYHDPAHMGFRSLRVINEDHVAPAAGFPTHPHRDMEIFSYVVSGTIQHQDSLGNGRKLIPGQIQLMSAGSGVTHSEFNPSSSEPLHLLQIWIRPRKSGLTPSYTEWHPAPDSYHLSKVLVISPDGRNSSATIQQDADVWRIKLQPGETTTHLLPPTRAAWLQLISGDLTVNGHPLTPGDAIHTEDPGTLEITASSQAEALLFDLA